jgi:hypothetical protein
MALSNFAQLFQDADAAIESAVSDFSIIIHPRPNGADFNVIATQSDPQFQDDYVPGSNPGSALLHLWIASSTFLALSRRPRKGDTATLNGVDYDVNEVVADQVGGGWMKLKTRNLPWNQ